VVFSTAGRPAFVVVSTAAFRSAFVVFTATPALRVLKNEVGAIFEGHQVKHDQLLSSMRDEITMQLET
jgi:hypothetical protein